MKISLSDHFTYKKLLRFVLPSVIMMVFTSIYGVVDGFFVSNYAGKTAFAAINLVMPFIMILGGMGFMIGTGGTALVAKQLGEGKPEEANRTFSIMVGFTVVFGAVLSVAGVALMRPVSLLLKATPAMLDDCILYGRIVTGFTVTFMLQNVFQSFLIAAEKPKLGLAVTVAAGVTNMILDWLFVGVFGWGIAGAAVATGISQCVGGVIPLFFFLKKDNGSRLHLTLTPLKARPILAACANGSSELMSNISSSVVSMIYNFQLLKFIGENGVSAYGTLMYVQFVFIAIYIGYAIGCAPIVGFHFGAENRAELKSLLKKSILLMAGTGIAMFGLAFALSGVFSGIFVGYDRELFDLTKHAFRMFSPAFLLAGYNIFASSFFTALSNGGVSAAISFLRTMICQSLSVLILPELFGVDGIWLSITVAEVCASMISTAFIFAKRKKYGYF